jgi:hypothetical protein
MMESMLQPQRTAGEDAGSHLRLRHLLTNACKSYLGMVRRVFCVVMLLTLAGCSSGQFDVAPVEGQVTVEGKPLTGKYMVIFSPIAQGAKDRAGRPAAGPVEAEGRYSLSTYEPGDGAVVGKHRVAVLPPGEISVTTPLPGVVPDDFEVEVKPEKNRINIDLKRWTPRR